MAKGFIQLLPRPLTYKRIETGALQFADDWPGLFIRGDNAMDLAIGLRTVETMLKSLRVEDVPGLRALQLTYSRLMQWAEIIERDVAVNHDKNNDDTPGSSK